jgi:hypothetical protein
LAKIAVQINSQTIPSGFFEYAEKLISEFQAIIFARSDSNLTTVESTENHRNGTNQKPDHETIAGYLP